MTYIVTIVSLSVLYIVQLITFLSTLQQERKFWLQARAIVMLLAVYSKHAYFVVQSSCSEFIAATYTSMEISFITCMTFLI
jgi:hypothetical protein